MRRQAGRARIELAHRAPPGRAGADLGLGAQLARGQEAALEASVAGVSFEHDRPDRAQPARLVLDHELARARLVAAEDLERDQLPVRIAALLEPVCVDEPRAVVR